MERKTSSRKKEYAQSLVKRHIPFLEGRPRRATPIDRDDVLNLEIALNTSKTVEELLKNL
jgi:hypothetical protein